MVEGRGREEKVENIPKFSNENKNCWWMVSWQPLPSHQKGDRMTMTGTGNPGPKQTHQGQKLFCLEGVSVSNLGFCVKYNELCSNNTYGTCLGKLRQENCWEFEPSLRYTVSSRVDTAIMEDTNQNLNNYWTITLLIAGFFYLKMFMNFFFRWEFPFVIHQIPGQCSGL